MSSRVLHCAACLKAIRVGVVIALSSVRFRVYTYLSKRFTKYCFHVRVLGFAVAAVMVFISLLNV